MDTYNVYILLILINFRSILLCENIKEIRIWIRIYIYIQISINIVLLLVAYKTVNVQAHY